MGDVTINVFAGDAGEGHRQHGGGGSQPPATGTLLDRFLEGKPSGAGGKDSLELIVRTRGGDRMLMVSLIGDVQADPIRLRGIIRSPQLAREYPFELHFTKAELASIRVLQTGPDELAVAALGGAPSGYRLGSYTITRTVNGQYVVHAGLLRTPKGNEAEFVAISDPLPPVLLGAIVVVGIIVGLCVLITLTSAALEALVDVSAILACLKAGGLPSVTVNATPHFKWGPGWTDLDISCAFSTSVTCAPAPKTATTGGATGGTGGTGGGEKGGSGGGSGAGTGSGKAGGGGEGGTGDVPEPGAPGH